jgi:hypothetical protein
MKVKSVISRTTMIALLMCPAAEAATPESAWQICIARCWDAYVACIGTTIPGSPQERACSDAHNRCQDSCNAKYPATQRPLTR